MSDEHEISGRTAAFEAAVRLALESVDDDSGWRYRPDLETSDVVAAAEADVSKRTALRACKDAVAVDWLKDKTEGWDAGPRAEKYARADGAE